MTCLDCKYFDPDDTTLPVCMKHRKYIEESWCCGEYESVEEENATEEEA